MSARFMIRTRPRLLLGTRVVDFIDGRPHLALALFVAALAALLLVLGVGRQRPDNLTRFIGAQPQANPGVTFVPARFSAPRGGVGS